jgi:hypothetical protein
MWRANFVRLVQAGALIALLCSGEAFAQNGPNAAGVTHVPIPSGATVQIDGKTARLMKGQGVAGTYECQCGYSDSGTCTLSNDPHGISCDKGPKDTCKAGCILITTSGEGNGEVAAGRRPAGNTISPPPGPAR